MGNFVVKDINNVEHDNTYYVYGFIVAFIISIAILIYMYTTSIYTLYITDTWLYRWTVLWLVAYMACIVMVYFMYYENLSDNIFLWISVVLALIGITVVSYVYRRYKQILETPEGENLMEWRKIQEEALRTIREAQKSMSS